MTACIYFSPRWDITDPSEGILPVLAADTMVTLQGYDWAGPLLPITGVNQGQTLFSTKLKRKLNIVKGCAIALSGHGDAIEEIVRHVHDEIDTWVDLDRPMRPFAEYMSNINNHFGRIVAEGTAVMRGLSLIHI